MTTTIATDPQTARRAAIDASGITGEFRLIQLRNPVFWVFLWALITGFIRLISLYQPDFGNYGGALVGGTAAFAFYTALWIVFLHHLDRFTPLPAKLLLVGFVWGSVVATTFLALSVNGAALNLYAKVFGTAWAQDWAAGFTAPITEETAKALGFVMLLGLAPHLFRSVFDAFVAGAFIGLGFEVAEDVLYVYQGAYTSFGTDQALHVFRIGAVRGLSGVASHAMFTALVCAGLMWILGRDPRGRNVVKGVGFILLAMVMHFGWDDAGAVGANYLGNLPQLVLLALVVVGLIIIVRVGHDSAVTERAWAYDILAPEIETGTLTEPEVAAVAGARRDRRHYVKSIRHHHERKVAKHVLAAAQELGVALGRGDGEDTADVQHARGEIARLRAR